MEIMMIENAPLTMSSREIAELTGKRHDNVKRTLEMLAERGVMRLPQIEEVKNHLGQTVQEYRLEKRESYIVVAQLSPEFTATLVDRWQELEKQVAQPLNPANLSRMDILQLALDAEKENQALKQENLQLENKLSEQQPKADGFDRIARAEGGMNLTNAAKSLNIRPKDLMDILQLKKWIYRRAGGKTFVGYQDKIQQGLLAHKVYSLTLPDGTERMSEQVVVNPKGLAKLSTLIPGWQAEAKADMITTA